MITSFLKDRKWSPKLKVALEVELARIPVPTKKNKTIEGYFRALKDYATKFALRKIEFINEFERMHGITFTDRYKRKYLAHCFDSYSEDLQNIAFNFLEIKFGFIINRDSRSDKEAYHKCMECLDLTLSDYIQKPLEIFLATILQCRVWDPDQKEKFQSLFRDIIRTLRKRGEKEIDRYFKKERNLTTSRDEFNKFIKNLRLSGFKI